ncbi:alpha/beta hydrolase [Amycolatopsis rhizosphaerae]|uniref:Alpha/beta hydrolase n=2 Tax=Amycolatopsis rhizosphaerae TaxID=2053003 RepID=A0A558CJE1_9PSEU|nr:alpha/beta hydrolase [Amycolatopsis rhizosphaerae]
MALFLAVMTPLPGAAVAAATPETGTVDWKPCPDAAGVECGTVSVPIDWSAPSGAKIEIALARRKASDPAARIGSLLMDPGGPGGSGVAAVKSGWTLSPEITRRFDTVGFDPRGVGGSHQVLCGQAEETAPYPEVPATPAEFRLLAEHNRALGESCRRLTGPLFDFLDTRSVVRDMDAIRAALGERKLTYYGISYGTLMGQQYAEAYPDRVRAMVLDSNMDHSITTAWEFLRSETTSLQENFDQFADWCARTPSCALHGQDVHAVFADLYAKAGRGELVDPSSNTKITQMQLLGGAYSTLAEPDWARLAEMMAALYPGKAYQEKAYQEKTLPQGETARGAGDVPVPDSVPGVFCEDWRLPVHDVAELDFYRQALDFAEPDTKLSPIGWKSVTGCVGWPARVRNPPRPLSVHGAPPLLMLNSRYDPETPYEWAETASRQSGAVLLRYDGWGHGVYFRNSACVVGAADAYLISGKVPPRGTHCAGIDPAAAPAVMAAARPSF